MLSMRGSSAEFNRPHLPSALNILLCCILFYFIMRSDTEAIHADKSTQLVINSIYFLVEITVSPRQYTISF